MEYALRYYESMYFPCQLTTVLILVLMEYALRFVTRKTDIEQQLS